MIWVTLLARLSRSAKRHVYCAHRFDTYANLCQIVEETFVNIYDYVAAMKSGEPAVLFPTYEAFREDALSRDADDNPDDKYPRIYPKIAAKSSFFLKALLKHVMARGRNVVRMKRGVVASAR